MGKWENRATLTGINHNTFLYSVSHYVMMPLRGDSQIITYVTLCVGFILGVSHVTQLIT